LDYVSLFYRRNEAEKDIYSKVDGCATLIARKF
jgi:hypothetical protein